MNKPMTATEVFERQREYFRKVADGHIILNRIVAEALDDLAANPDRELTGVWKEFHERLAKRIKGAKDVPSSDGGRADPGGNAGTG